MSLPQYALVDASPPALLTLPVSPRFGMQKAIKDSDEARETFGGVKFAVALSRSAVWTMTFRFRESDLAAFELLHTTVDGQLTPFYFYYNGDTIYGRKEAGFAPVQLTTPAGPPIYDYTLIITGEPVVSDIIPPVKLRPEFYEEYEDYDDPVWGGDFHDFDSRIENGNRAIDSNPATFAACHIAGTGIFRSNYASLHLYGFPEPTHTVVTATIHIIAECDKGGNTGGANFEVNLFNQRNIRLVPGGNTTGLVDSFITGDGSSSVAKAEYTVEINASSWISNFSSMASNLWVRCGQWDTLPQGFSPDILLKIYDCWIEYEY